VTWADSYIQDYFEINLNSSAGPNINSLCSYDKRRLFNQQHQPADTMISKLRQCRSFAVDAAYSLVNLLEET